ncbi:hypothetical protein BKG94_07270 [Rodentibacter ratti]|uniref:ash family protein n=1 Tax=Rodentibacter ratti TaxID=1906745 RepID=UPI000985C12E|nr:ash family protein [Rodentibacter ratti]OOF88324.1 hypothetical protein BKG94_07270 [Rodentibacter ratti]
MNLNQLNYKQYENNSQCKIFTKCGQINYSLYTFAKSKVQAWKPDELYTANSTPNRAFFVRNIRTPKENNERKNALVTILSMVERIGQRLIVGYFPCMVVFHPDTFYRQAWKLAVDCQNLYTEFSSMIYKFLFTGSRFRIAVYANSLNEALARLPKANQRPVLVSRIKGGAHA